jgi:hypothetical protein
MKVTSEFAVRPPETRPQDAGMDGSALRFKTLGHGGEYPDTMDAASDTIADRDGPSCVHVPVTVNGPVADSKKITGSRN